MKPSVDRSSRQYLSSLEKGRSDKPDFYYNQLDAIDKIIYEEGLRIKQVYFDKDLDLMMVLLTNRKIIKVPLSTYSSLSNADKNQLQNYENDGTGIHWPELDEDLSLRGFLKYELSHLYTPVVG